MCGIYGLGSTFRTMPVTQIVSSAPQGARARCRTAMTFRRAAFALGVIGMMAGAAVVTAGPALAGVGSEPGNVRFSPGSGATTLTPTWSTTDGCPTGYQGSAQMSVFTSGGRFLSSISGVAYFVTKSFSGKLDGSMAAILKFAHIHQGGTLAFVMGCYSRTAGTGKVKWIQSAVVTLVSGGKSYTSSAPSGQQGSTSGQQGSASAQAGGGSGANAGAAAANDASDSATHTGGGMGAPAVAAWIAAACAAAAATAGLFWYRRRNRSRM